MTKANTPKRAKKKKKKTSAPEVKVLITAVALAATLGGWAGMAAPLASPTSPPVVEQAAPSLPPAGSGTVNAPAPPALRKAVPPPVTRTRSSR
ncbi:MAG: hypothetical protein ACPGWR_01890 [Ardenticatenaceae bacterium]